MLSFQVNRNSSFYFKIEQCEIVPIALIGTQYNTSKIEFSTKNMQTNNTKLTFNQ